MEQLRADIGTWHIKALAILGQLQSEVCHPMLAALEMTEAQYQDMLAHDLIQEAVNKGILSSQGTLLPGQCMPSGLASKLKPCEAIAAAKSALGDI